VRLKSEIYDLRSVIDGTEIMFSRIDYPRYQISEFNLSVPIRRFEI